MAEKGRIEFGDPMARSMPRMGGHPSLQEKYVAELRALRTEVVALRHTLERIFPTIKEPVLPEPLSKLFDLFGIQPGKPTNTKF